MKRKCDHCEHEATVHEVTIRNGKKVEKHLCESCAREEGIATVSHTPISELLTSFVMSQSGQPVRQREKGKLTCPSCGLTFEAFRQHGLLGCADCYKGFEDQLGPLIERAHDGATHHVGKVPERGGVSMERQERLALLRKQLADAVKAEQYEEAASLRDQIMSVERGGTRAGGGSGEGEA